MGRELMRVTPNFDWPLKKVWAGYDNPYYWGFRRDCPECGSDGPGGRRGFSAYANHLYGLWFGDVAFRPEDNNSEPWLPSNPFIEQIIRAKVKRDTVSWLSMYECEDIETAILLESMRMCEHYNSAWQYHLNQQDIIDLVNADRLWEFTRRPISPEQETWPNGWTKEPNGYTPSRDEVLKWHMSGMGMSGSEAFAIIRARCQREGEPLECERCAGSGDIWESQAAKRLHDEWEETEPPEGDWWQVWETVSAGSPVTPAFATADELINHLIHKEGYSEGAAESFVLGNGWAPSLVLGNGRFYKDIEALNIPREDDDLSILDSENKQPDSTPDEPEDRQTALYTAVAGILIFFVLIMLLL